MSKILDVEKKTAIRTRLARVEGQLRGVQRLIDEDADCETVAQQLSAARKALDKSFFAMVACIIEQGETSSQDVAAMLTKFA
jgi:CsoR family transcriptional regulator, copper-sensing transcriptional repressor